MLIDGDGKRRTDQRRQFIHIIRSENYTAHFCIHSTSQTTAAAVRSRFLRMRNKSLACGLVDLAGWLLLLIYSACSHTIFIPYNHIYSYIYIYIQLDVSRVLCVALWCACDEEVKVMELLLLLAKRQR